MKNWLNIQDRVYIVTGGSSGIGAAIIKGLVNQGAKVVDADLNAPKENDERVTFIKTDVTNKKDVINTVSNTIKEMGRIDGLVNNAGICVPGLLIDLKEPNSKFEINEDIFNKMFAINVKGDLLMAQAVARHLVKQKYGVIVNMASTSGFDGSQGQSVYAATKAAIIAFTRSWAKELGKFNVRVVGMAPGIMDVTGLRTPAYDEALAYTRNITVDQLNADYSSTSKIPMNRSGHLYEVADLAAYLLSDRSSYITGVTIKVAGGKSM